LGSINSIRDLVSALWRKAWLIVLVMAIGIPALLAYVTSRPKLFEATAVIQIQAPEVAVTTAGQVRGQTADGQLDLIIQNMFARDNIDALIARFDLFPALESEIERVDAMRDAITAVKLIDPALAWRPDVQPSGLSITVRLDDPEVAANVANALLDQIITEARSRTEGRATRTLEFLVGEEARVAGEIARIESQIAEFRAVNLDSLPEGLTAQRDRLTRLNESRLALEQQAIELQGARDRLRAEEVATQETLIANQIALVAQDIAGIEAAVAAAPEVERQLTAMTRTLDQLEAELTVLTTQRTEAATAQLLASQEQSERFVVLETAIAPQHPVSTSRTKLALAGGVALVMLALGLALATEILQPAIRTAAQLERQLGVQPVIVVPRLHSRGGRIRRALAWLLGGLVAGGGVVAVIANWGKAIGGLLGLNERAAAAVPVVVRGTRPVSRRIR